VDRVYWNRIGKLHSNSPGLQIIMRRERCWEKTSEGKGGLQKRRKNRKEEGGFGFTIRGFTPRLGHSVLSLSTKGIEALLVVMTYGGGEKAFRERGKKDSYGRRGERSKKIDVGGHVLGQNGYALCL